MADGFPFVFAYFAARGEERNRLVKAPELDDQQVHIYGISGGLRMISTLWRWFMKWCLSSQFNHFRYPKTNQSQGKG
jgi:hypothetical protein